MKIMVLGNILIFICFVVSYAFSKTFIEDTNVDGGLGKIYVIIGFEVSIGLIFSSLTFFYCVKFIRLLLKGVQHNFKY